MPHISSPKALALASALLFAAVAVSVSAATLTVNSTSDAVNGSDGLCTLREAIVAANGNAASGGVAGECAAGQPAPTVDVIAFAIPGTGVRTIAPAAALPPMADPVTIDGYTQAGSSPNTQPTGGSNAVLRVEINGTNAGSAAPLLRFAAGSAGSELRGLIVNRAQASGVHLAAPVRVAGNFIGTEASGAWPEPNASHGVEIVAPGPGLIGGSLPAERNVIAFNGGHGVRVDAAASLWRIVGNRMVANLGKGIALADGPLPLANDVLDADTGANGRQNFPLIDSVTLTATTVRVQGRVVGAPSRTLLLDFYGTRPPETPAQFLQGESYLGPAPSPIATDAQGRAAFDVTLPWPSTANLWVTATLTDTTGCFNAACGNTSEFSQRGVFMVAPRHGGAASALPVTVTGHLFGPGASFAFGATPANGIGFADAQTLTGVLPLLNPGTLYDVTVTNPDATTAMMPKAFVTDFADVAAGTAFYPYVMSIAANGITLGCQAGQFCGVNEVSRASMALFLVRALHGPFFAPPPATGVFADVPPGVFPADWIEQFYTEGITSGCATQPLRYCPDSAVTRAQMAVFLLRAKHGPGYLPPACTGLFADVPCSPPAHLFANWIEQLAREGITAGCAVNPLRYCPDVAVLRLQMAVFLTRVFGLSEGVNAAPGVNAGADQTITLPASAALAGNATDDGRPSPPGALTYAWSKQSGPGTVTFGNPNDVATTASFSAAGVYVLRLTVSDGALSASDDVQVTVSPQVVLPPNPQTVATPLQPGVVSDIGADTAFLYTGPTPIQTGVVPGTIDRLRAAVLRGRVLDRGGAAIGGVAVAVLGRPNFGQTLTRADGRFDLAVNGGEVVTLSFARQGLLPVQRQVRVPLRDYRVLDDVVMIGLDARVTTIAANAPVMQVHQGNVVVDADGTRTSTLLIPAGTTVSLVMPDGSTQSLAAINVRATEYTVGAGGARAMPAVLPPASHYTYAAELGADEAIAAGAADVVFNQPLFNYVDNFLGFPVGTAVPTAAYDAATAAWIPASNGRVVQITGIAGGLATVDSVGAGALPPLVLGVDERQRLAQLFAVGQELWRVPITHFTPWDHNWPAGPPLDATPPNVPSPETGDTLDDPTCSTGSIIECENQVLGETVRVVGTPYALNYRSARVPGRTAERTLRIPLTLASAPASLKSVQLDVQVAGQRFEQTFTGATNQQTTYTWDGRDAYGRALPGRQPVTAEIKYVYDAVYRTPADLDASFGLPGGVSLSADRVRGEITLGRAYFGWVGTLDARTQGLGGWTLGPHHLYDPQEGRLYLGDGRRRGAAALGAVIHRVRFENPIGTPLQGGRYSIAFGPDGSLYVAGLSFASGSVVHRLLPNGLTVPFGAVPLENVASAIAVGPDGSVYVLQPQLGNGQGNRLSRIAPDGTTTVIAGQPLDGFSGDGGPASLARFRIPKDVAVGPDGSIYVADTTNRRVRRIGPDGVIMTVAGSGALCNVPQPGVCGDGGLATQAALGYPESIAVASDGTLYIFEFDTVRIRRVGTDGIISTFAGNGAYCRSAAAPLPCGDGGPATLASLGSGNLGIGPGGALYLIEGGESGRVRMIGADGAINSVAGRNDSNAVPFVDGMPARQALLDLNSNNDVAVAADGAIYIANIYEVYRVVRTLPWLALTDYAIASESGGELYIFDARGRHLRTLHTLTGAMLREFTYDAQGRLASIVEKTGGIDNVTTIQRNASGDPTAIVAPFGQVTTFQHDANGYLASTTNPASEVITATYAANGLLTQFVRPGNRVSSHQYDADGRLVRADDPAGGFKTLARVAIPDGFEVSKSTALGRVTSYRVQASSQELALQTVDPDLSQRDFELRQDATWFATFADGAAAQGTSSPDPRFGMQAPFASSTTVSSPGGLAMNRAITRAAVLATPGDLLSLASLAESVVINGQTTLLAYDGSTRSGTLTSPAGRIHARTLDVRGRLIGQQFGSRLPVSYAYDSRGRLSGITHGTGPGSRNHTLVYAPNGYLQSLTDPLGRTAQYTRDAVGRVTAKTMPGGDVAGFAFDAAGDLVSVTPPGRPPHTITYDARGDIVAITPPVVPGTGPTTFTYNADGQTSLVVMPGGESIAYGYDAAGRLGSRTLTNVGVPNATFTIGRDAAGRVTNLGGPGGQSMAVSYDGGLATALHWTGPVAGSLTRTYDNEFRVAIESVNVGAAIGYTYDADGYATQIGDLAMVRSVDDGRVLSTSLGVVADTTTRNGFGEGVTYAVTANATPVFTFNVTRDAAGRIVQKQETIGGLTTTYSYQFDARGRLVGVDRNGVPFEAYSYDANGNRISATVGGVVGAATFDVQDRQLTDGSTTFTYTASGRLASRVEGGITTTYRYDASGSLLQVQLGSGTVIDYEIDGLEKRVGKRVNGAPVNRYLHSGRNYVAELDSAGSLASRFIFGPGGKPLYMVRGGVNYRFVADPIGSVRLVVDAATGAVAQRLDYDSFGNVLLDTNPGFQPFGFAGGLYDHQTGLVRFGVRDYDPRTGRWTAKDPAGFGGADTNLYAYAFNDPVNFDDPNGRLIPAVVVAGAAVIYAAVEAGLSIADWVGFATDLFDPNVSWQEAGLTGLGAAAGIVLPGGGYGAGMKGAKKVADDAGEVCDLFVDTTEDLLKRFEYEKFKKFMRQDIKDVIRDAGGDPSKPLGLVKDAGGAGTKGTGKAAGGSSKFWN